MLLPVFLPVLLPVLLSLLLPVLLPLLLPVFLPVPSTMEAVSTEVLYLGTATLVAGALLYHAVLHMFRTVCPPGTEGQVSPGTEGQVSPTDGRTRSGAQDCAICLGRVTLALETSCGHVYCGACVLEVWRRGPDLQATPCPYCRQRITALLPYFSEEERSTRTRARTRLLVEVHTYNYTYYYSGQTTTVPGLLRHLVHYLATGETRHLR